MTADNRHHAPRHPTHDYSRAGAYFITVRTQHGVHLFGTVHEGAMRRSPAGEMVAAWWREIAQKYPTVRIDAFVIMPNHVHGVLIFRQGGTVSLPDVMRWFKAMTTNAYIRGVTSHGWPRFPGKLWQRSYHDRIIASSDDLTYVRQYIRANPANWKR